MTDLDKLIEAVEGGVARHSNFAAMFPYPICDHAREAQSGSLDAAKALHEALLPGWGYKLEGHVKVYFAWVGREDEMLFPQHSTSYDNPARAWLIAILKAYRAQVHHD